MEILSINAENNLASLAVNISQNTKTWHDWIGLHIDLSPVPEDSRQDCILWSESIIKTYLYNAKGRAFYCNDQDLWLVCKNISPEILKQSAQQIADLIFSEFGEFCDDKIFEFSNQSTEFVQTVFSKSQDHISIAMPDTKMPESSALEQQNLCANTNQNHAQEQTKVMLVEDDPVTRWMVQNAVQKECEFVSVPSANTAFSTFANFEPDIVFLDIGLPDKSGYEVLEWILRHDPGSHVIMFSGSDDIDNMTNALNKGAAGFIAKPFLKENLLHYIHNYGYAKAI